MRIFIAGLLGGIAMFIWTSIAHTVLPLGQIGFSQIPDEQHVLDTLHSSIGDRAGLYFFPWVDMTAPDAMQKSAAARAANPGGWMIYHPPGQQTEMTPLMLVAEFGKELAQAMIAAFLASLILAGFSLRVAAVTLIGVSAGLATNGSYFIWYGFPASYTLVQILVEAVAALFAGIAIAYWLGRTPATR